MAESGDYETLTKTVEPSEIYERTAGDIGLLSGEEVDSFVEFYTDLYWLRPITI